ncbi:hypothetical protein RHMOL_Rhmol12G0235400 [Rhododendron molle]|nr:hypothetical protein RHMOL_Rhmol12G0235400 [Rhododendron molle]
MDHAKAELKVADSKKWAAIKKAKEAEDKAAKYVARAERKEKEAAEARELADKYAADAKKMGAEAQAARAAADAASKHVEGKKNTKFLCTEKPTNRGFSVQRIRVFRCLRSYDVWSRL